jgi:hypothetical protein
LPDHPTCWTALQEIWASGALEQGKAKKNSILKFLGEAKQGLQLPSIRLPSTTKLFDITFDGLPSGIRLQPDQLTTHFQGATDLL